ncbi:PREDICTED: uncharacterized protein LOC109223364 isoform X2 [Nicotiana attenuata]|uniref:uncharacterized protein LOC109223364 isoform X2 n=1 Tax=Nicotiana attenuata TaxID=49451 RepID=UPI0009054C40|nr:PREDICTED: uncharacterized protein LOC109223364 isoform X2 [Nicotiana attenuata]
MTGREGAGDFVYRISTLEEWELLQKTGSTFGGELDRTTGYIHLSKLDQLGNGLVYEAIDDSNVFPHFYGPSRSFSPLPLDAVIKGEKLVVSDGKFVCSMLSSVA